MFSNSIGVLVIHGFTGTLQTVEGIKPFLEKERFVSLFPTLRGHGTYFKDLNGVTSKEWYEDAEKALIELSRSVEKVVVVGLSMGGLIALELAFRHSDKIIGVVTVAAALKFKNPLAPFVSYLHRLIPYWPSPNAYRDPVLKKRKPFYRWFPTKTFQYLFEYSKKIEQLLPQIKTPLLVIHSKKDSVISPKSAEIIYQKTSSPEKTIRWFTESDHEMMSDIESKKVFEEILRFLLSLRSALNHH